MGVWKIDSNKLNGNVQRAQEMVRMYKYQENYPFFKSN